MKRLRLIAVILASLVLLALFAVIILGLLPDAAEPLTTPTPDRTSVQEGAVLAYAQDGSIWLGIDGRSPQALNTSGYGYEAALSPDASMVAYLLVPDEQLEQAPLPAQLWLVDLATDDARQLSTVLCARSRLSWSPDGQSLSVIEDGSLAVYATNDLTRKVVSADLARDGLTYAGYAWLPTGNGLTLLTEDATGQQAVRMVGISGGQREVALPTAVRASAVSFAPDGSAATLLVPETGAVYALDLAGDALDRLTPEGVIVTGFAWSSDGSQLAYGDAGGNLWLAERGDAGLQTARLVAEWNAPVADITWPAVDQLTATLAVRGGTATAQFSTAEGAMRTAGLDAMVQGLSTPEARPAMDEATASFYWYRFQGDTDSGDCASVNCGPTSVAMAIEFGDKDLYVPVSEIRTFISGGTCGYTDGTQLRTALTAWGIPYQRISGLSAVREAVVERGHIVIVPVIMGDISPGSDYEVWNSDPDLIYGRYYSYNLGHWLVVRGFSQDGQWVEVYDPNVWYSGKYHYADGEPKGRDRLYPYGEFATALYNNSNWATEITAAPTPALPLAPTEISATDGAYADRVEIAWAAADGATSYTVSRSATAGGALESLGSATQAAFTDAGIQAGVVAYYWVAACNGAGCSDPAGPDSGYRAVLGAPDGLIASDHAYTDHVRIAWSAVDEATSYALYRSETTSGELTLLAEPEDLAWDDLTAIPGETYWYAVRACNALGCSGYSARESGVCAYTLPGNRVLIPSALRGAEK